MIKIFRLKNWEIFLTIFFIPFLIHLNLPFLTKSLIPTAIFVLIWIWLISIWIFKLADYFKTEHIERYEIKLLKSNLILLNLIFIIVAPITLLLFYKDLPILDSALDVLSKIDDYIRIYIYLASITILIIASRIITAKRLQKKLSIQDYYKSAISFIFLPIGIFWIQNEIKKLIGGENKDEKKRGYIIISITVLMVIGTIINFKEKEFNVSFGNQDSDEFMIDSALIEKSRKQSDSIFNSMNDSAKADYIFNAALQLYQMGNFRDAINNISYSIQLDSLNSEYYYNRGVILYEQFNQLDSAIMDLTKTIEIDPSDWRAYQNRGYYNFLLENYDIVLPDINKVIDLKPDFSNAYLLRGMIKEKLNDKDGACLDLRKAYSLGNVDALIKIMEICN